MSNYCYEAVNAGGAKVSGSLEVIDQSEALKRIREMGLFPVKIILPPERRRAAFSPAVKRKRAGAVTLFGTGIRPAALCVFTRQLTTLIEAGMPLLRGLRILEEQETNPRLKSVIVSIAESIEGGGSLSDALTRHPKTFNRLYVNMVRAGELGGVLELTLRRLAEFMEKAQKTKRKVKAALFYPVAVLTVAAAIIGILMVYVVPKFKEVFDGLMGGQPLPSFTLFILAISEAVKNHFFATGAVFIGVASLFLAIIRTRRGRLWFDHFKLVVPALGPVFRKSAISRFARTLGTLLGSGVPVLQALLIVRETSGNHAVADVISDVHDSVKEGETICAPLKHSGIFPAMVAGMVDIGEQTGALPDMLMKIADNYDDDVDNAVSAMTSLLEPIMIVFLAVIVGSIVIAMFLPLIRIMTIGFDAPAGA